MTDYVSTITIDNVIDALADVIGLFVEGAEVIRAQVNRVAMPNPCVVLTEIMQSDLSVPRVEYDPDNDAAILHGPSQINVQIDFYGAKAGEWCKSAKTALRSSWGVGQFPANIKPLYTNDGMQSPLVTGEQQYESRWTLTVIMQYNPTVSVPQQYADVVTVDTFRAVDIF